MSLIYTPKYFAAWELLHPEIYKLVGDKGLLMFDPLIIEGIDAIRYDIGPCVVNTYGSKSMIKKYGLHRYRGLRPLNSKIGAKYSMHKTGGSCDVVPLEISISALHYEIRDNQIFWGKFFTRVEKCKPNGKPITWLHFDNKPHNKPSPIHFFKP